MAVPVPRHRGHWGAVSTPQHGGALGGAARSPGTEDRLSARPVPLVRRLPRTRLPAESRAALQPRFLGV